ncbi:MAG: TlpA family protein disulfide reductase [Phycisphaeraceae bacterium]|nr:TlpA family protein disulfide reductase [Phycisphaeraceae bacterium]
MDTRKRRTHGTFKLSLLAGLAVGLAAAVATGAPPTDAQIEALIAKVQEAQRSTDDRQAATAAAVEACKQGLKDLSIAECSLEQFRKLDTARLAMMVPELRAAAAPRLKELAAAPTIDGVRALAMSAAWYPDAADRTAEARRERDLAIARIYAQCVKHPAIGDLLMSETDGPDFVSRFGRISPQAAKEAGLVEAAPVVLGKDMCALAAARAPALFDMMPNDESGQAQRQRVRVLALGAVDKAMAAVDKAEADSPLGRAKPSLERSRMYLSGAFAKGELVDHAAPTITFEWTTDDKIKSLADLKGRVVVVDFWATWCGPCIASFPNVRELQKRYEGYPVTILGVTSIQGSHSNPKTRERTDTKGKPELEHELMTGFIKDMEVTWPVAFAHQEVFNPEYGVRGIPHVAIIDPSGKVRYNGLHPGGSLKDKADKIDALLKAAGLPAPEPVAEPEKKEGQ